MRSFTEEVAGAEESDFPSSGPSFWARGQGGMMKENTLLGLEGYYTTFLKYRNQVGGIGVGAVLCLRL